jgi:hypothetical protein
MFFHVFSVDGIVETDSFCIQYIIVTYTITHLFVRLGLILYSIIIAYVLSRPQPQKVNINSILCNLHVISVYSYLLHPFTVLQ